MLNKVFIVKPAHRQTAQRESLALVSLLKANGITVVTEEDSTEVHTLLSIFPTSWFSMEDGGTLVIYPVCPARRDERKSVFLDTVRKNTDVRRVIDLSCWEERERYLEGTGSLVFDRAARRVFAARSPYTSEEVAADFCKRLGYSYTMFDTADEVGNPVNRTDMVLAVTSTHAIVCSEAFASPAEAAEVRKQLKKTGHEIIEITYSQMHSFAANVVELENETGTRFLMMSGRARKGLAPEQQRSLGAAYRILSPELDTIEDFGGASVGAMLVKLF